MPRVIDGSQTKDVFTRTELIAVASLDGGNKASEKVIGSQNATLFAPGRIQVTPASLLYSGTDDLKFFLIAHDLELDLQKSSFTFELREEEQANVIAARIKPISSRWIEVSIPKSEMDKVAKHAGSVEIRAQDSVHKISANVSVKLAR